MRTQTNANVFMTAILSNSVLWSTQVTNGATLLHLKHKNKVMYTNVIASFKNTIYRTCEKLKYLHLLQCADDEYTVSK